MKPSKRISVAWTENISGRADDATLMPVDITTASLI